MLGFLLMLLSVVVVTRMLQNRQKETQSRKRETGSGLTVTPTTNSDDKMIYSTLVHTKPRARREENK
ncbi:hypothetical protein GN956_G26455, partial [Arapaima gigas]